MGYIRPLCKGLLTFIPGVMPGVHMLFPKRGGGGTKSASYCYGVWLKHLTLLWDNGMSSIPKTVAELGPGETIGVGLASILCGANKYYALDVVKHSNVKSNLQIFDELVALISSRSSRPTKGWPDFDRYLDSNLFPSHILTDKILNKSLSEKRIKAIRNALINLGQEVDGIKIQYMVPWTSNETIKRNTVDLVLSHSVLEHVQDIPRTYEAISLWLKQEGLMSHQIDFSSHGLSEEWNGYRAYSELLWKLIYGKRTYLINRHTISTHVENIENKSFKVLCNLKNFRQDGLKKSEISSYWSNISNEDLNCCGAFIAAAKRT